MATSAIASSTHIFTSLTLPNSTLKFSVHLHPAYSSLRFPLPIPFTISPLKSITTPNRTITFKVRSSSMAESKPFLKKKGNTDLTVFDSEEELSVSLAKYVADLSAKFVKERGAFTVVLSGGSLIKSLTKLVKEPYVGSIEWSRWHVFWVDERVVPKDHPDSNYKLAFDGFLSKFTGPTYVVVKVAEMS